ncbi:hypothetical protein C8F01DRAFT_1176250 [Mycena amicta]|nr:hypothetical protein C8F01DRAFT_1176250 [Mycena amicta]
MFFKAALFISALSLVAAIPQDIPEPITATRVFKTITNVAPFIVDATTVFTFTYASSLAWIDVGLICRSPSPSTSIAFPTGSPV